jgi:hypothetical protein
MVTNNNELTGVGNTLIGIEAALTPQTPVGQTEAEATHTTEQESNVAQAENESGVIVNLFNRAFGLDDAVANADPAIFDLNFTVGSSSYLINWDPRNKPFLSDMCQLIKAVICCFMFYLLIMYLWDWYEKKVESLANTNPSGTSGEAILGTNANIATSAVNATIIMACVVAFMGVIILLISSSVGGSLIGEFMNGDNVIDGTHSAWSSLSGQQVLIFLDMVLPISCIISVCFTYMIVKIAGHTIWIGCTTIIKYANA